MKKIVALFMAAVLTVSTPVSVLGAEGAETVILADDSSVKDLVVSENTENSYVEEEGTEETKKTVNSAASVDADETLSDEISSNETLTDEILPDEIKTEEALSEETQAGNDLTEESQGSDALTEETSSEEELIVETEFPSKEETENQTESSDESLIASIEEMSVSETSEIIDSGTCGDELTWVLDGDGTLTISGTGNMEEWNSSASRPWYSYRSSITSVIIEDGVTTIGSYAFDSCGNLLDITISDTVVSIGYSAFGYCKALIEAVIPENLVSIGERAFLGCTALISIILPDSVTDIGTEAFKNCSSLIDINIPSKITQIEDSTFYACKSLNSISISGSISSIQASAFYECTGLTDFEFSDGLISIGDAAFAGCTGFTCIVIPSSVTSIGSGAFTGCTGLTNVTIPDSVIFTGPPFKGCTGLVTAGPIGGDYNFEFGFTESIPDYLFGYCTALISVDIPDSVTSIGYDAFSHCTSLTNIIIPEGVTSIGEYAFSYCTNISNIIIPDAVTSIAEGTFKGCSNFTSVIIQDNITVIGRYAFQYCTNLTSVVIMNGVSYIRESAFAYCSVLNNITIPDSVISIQARAFEYCYDLSDIYYTGSEEEWSSITIGSNNKYLTNASIHYNYIGPTTAPLTLTNVVNGTSVGIQIEWNALDGASGYCISRKTSTDDSYEVIASIDDTSAVSYVDTADFSNGVTYTYRVQGQDSNENDLGDYGEESITYVAPVSLSEPVISYEGVTLSWDWDYTVDDSTYFYIYRRLEGYDWELLGSSTGSSYLDSDATVSYGKIYYSVEVSYSDGTSARCEPVCLDLGFSISDVSVAKYMKYEIDGEEYEGFYEDFGMVTVGEQVCFSVEVTVNTGISLEFDESEWSCSDEEAIVFGDISVIGPTTSESDDTKQVYYLSIVADLQATGKYTVEFSFLDATAKSEEIIIAATNSCGDDLTWDLSADGTLTISGTGEMWDYDLETDEDGKLLNAPPWEKYDEKVSSIVIEDGVTSIGTYAFRVLGRVRSLTIGTGMLSVGAYGLDVSSPQYGTKIYFTGASPDIDKAAFGNFDNVIDAYYIPSMDAIIWADTVSATYENALVSWISSEDLSGNLSASDVFSFNNSDTYFGDEEEGYYLSSSDCEKLMSNLNIIQKYAIKWYSTSGTNVYHYNLDGNGYLKRSYEEWGGSCSGMVHLIALGLKGCFSASTFNSGASTYSDIDNGLVPISKKTESIINFYQLQQYLPQYDDLKSSFMKKNQYAQLTILDDELEKTSSSTASGTAGAVMISFQLKNTDDSGQIKKEGHVIMGFAVEKGTFHVEINGQTYTFDHRVLTYDPSKCSDMFENEANRYYQQYSLYYYTGGGSSEARWAIPGYDIISTTNDIDIYSENDTANFKLVTSSLNVLNAIDYSTGILNLTTQVKNAYLSARSTSSFTVTTSENTDYVIKNGQIDGIGTVSDDIVVYVGDTDDSTTASGSELTVSLSGLDEAYTVRTDSADSFSMLYENVGLSACCAADGSTIQFDPAGMVSAVMDSADSCVVSITANEGYSSLEYPTIEISGENVSSLSAQLTDDGNILIEGDDLSEVTINGDMLDGEETEKMAVSSDEDTILLCQDEDNNLTVYEDADGDGNYETVIAKTTGDISSFTFTLASDSFVYDGSAKTPAVSVCDESGTALTEGTDYTIAYTDNVNAGTATVAITGMGAYWGTVTKTFTISKANQTVIASIASSTIAVGETTQITASGEGSITYSSSDSSIAAVRTSGAVTGEKAGSATITVTAAGTENFNSGSKDLTITVTANDSPISDNADSNEAPSDNSGENASSGTSGSGDNQSGTSESGNIQSDGSGESTDNSATSVQLAAGKIKKLKNTAKGIVIKWTAVSNASGYYIYRKSGSGAFEKIAAVSGSSTVSYTDTSVKSKNGKTYTYKVVPYAGSLEGTGASAVIVRLVATKLTSVKNTASKKAVVKWSRKAKVTGYQIQYSTSKTFSKNTKKVKVSGAKKVSKTLSKLKKGKTYYVRIRTYKTVNGKTYYSAWSSKKKVKISK